MPFISRFLLPIRRIVEGQPQTIFGLLQPLPSRSTVLSAYTEFMSIPQVAATPCRSYPMDGGRSSFLTEHARQYPAQSSQPCNRGSGSGHLFLGAARSGDTISIVFLECPRKTSSGSSISAFWTAFDLQAAFRRTAQFK